ncbi:MAG TPA: hypothetical protein VFW63_00660 [Acidimicrobiales bacterium]|nr:hypothetical protein [Acidimicrobiales bacterium]
MRGGHRSLLAAGAAVLAVLATGCGGPPEEVGEVTTVDRVLVVSLPGLDWERARAEGLPHLSAFVDRAAVADVATRIGRRPTGPADAYLSIGAGTRAFAPPADTAVAVEADEAYGGVPAAELVARRLGPVRSGIAYLGVGAAVDVNEASSYGARVGLLGDELDAAGVRRAVVANADAVEALPGDEAAPEGSYARGAATALMGSDGVVPGGAVSRSLLRADPDAAFGWRLDHDRALAAVDRTWEGGGRAVVLVEASDLDRVAAYGGRASARQRRELADQALADADALLGKLVARTDPRRDAVLVLSPVAPPGAPSLGVAALRAPGVGGGLLESAGTRRAGYVQLADVAPTVLSLLGEEPPDDMEGCAFQVADGHGDRTAALADAADAAAFRDDTMPLVVTAITVGLVLLTLATLVRDRLPPGGRRAIAPLGYGALGLVPGTFLVGRVGAVRADLPGQAAVVVAVGAVVAVACTLVDRRRPGWGAVVACGGIVGLVLVDLLAGAPLQLNTTFGYSVAVAGRFTGLGNLAFALFGSAAIVLASLLADRLERRGLAVAVGLLALVVVVEGMPTLGADVGGVVSMVPAFGVTVLVLAGRRLGWREVAVLALLTGTVLFAFALVDAARPEGVQTHLARLANQVLDGRWDMLSKNLGRRWQASLGGAELAGWITVGAAMALACLYAVAVAAGRMGPGATRPLRHRPTRAAAAGLAVLGTVGLVANDSSVAVPMTMLIVVGPAGVLQAVAPSARARRSPPPAPEGRPVGEHAPADVVAPGAAGRAAGAGTLGVAG